MEIPENRRWMYIRKDPQRNRLSQDFIWGVETFISAAMQLDVFKSDGKFRCPCLRCKCLRFHEPDVVRKHLYSKGFQPRYYYWHNHGEIEPSMFDTVSKVQPSSKNLNTYERMVVDAGRPSYYVDPEPEDKKAESTYGAFKKLKETKLTQGEDQVDDSTLFYEATGESNKKGRSYDFGSEVPFYAPGSGSGTNTSSTPLTAAQAQQINERLSAVEEKNQYLEERNQYLESELLKIRRLVEQLTKGSTSGGQDTSTLPIPPSDE